MFPFVRPIGAVPVRAVPRAPSSHVVAHPVRHPRTMCWCLATLRVGVGPRARHMGPAALHRHRRRREFGDVGRGLRRCRFHLGVACRTCGGIKPTAALWMLVGVRRRSFWVGLVVVGLAALPLGSLWVEWLTVVQHVSAATPYYLTLFLVFAPAVLWMGRRGGSGSHGPRHPVSVGSPGLLPRVRSVLMQHRGTDREPGGPQDRECQRRRQRHGPAPIRPGAPGDQHDRDRQPQPQRDRGSAAGSPTRPPACSG